MSALNVRTPVWVKNPAFSDVNKDELWISTVVEGKQPDRDLYNIRVKVNNKDKFIRIQKGLNENDEIKLKNPVPTSTDIDNILDLPYLNEPEILLFLKERYTKGATFTFSGSVLLSLNPFEDIVPTEESKQLLKTFVYGVFSNNAEYSSSGVVKEGLGESNSSSSLDKLDEDQSFPRALRRSMSRDLATGKHTIIISGESGSGKTMCFNGILNLLSHGDGLQYHDKNDVIQQLSSCNVLLECFGNAKTVHTSNSSRFGKIIKFRLINHSLKILSCSIQTYLLEQSRICRQGKNERNFNIFYILVAGILHTTSSTSPQAAAALKEGDSKKYYLLNDINQYHYLTQGGVITKEEIDQYSLKYKGFLQALDQLTIHHYQINEIQQIISSILLLGNILFEEKGHTTPSYQLANDLYFTQIAELLGLPKESLVSLLTKKHFSTPNGETIELDLDAIQSITARDAIVKLIYRCLFLYLVEEINNKLELFMATQDITDSERNSKGNHNFVQLLDIFGFDSFEKNSINQMCINYVNETLHKQFNSYIFQMEMELYESEGINYDKIEYSDNTENVELISNGIFRILDDQCRLPHPTDKRFIAQLYKEYDLHPLFSVSELQHAQDKFTIKHYAGNVEYQADDFISKNLDYTPTQTATILAQSKNSILSTQFSAAVHVSEVTVKRRGSVIVPMKGNELSQLFTNKKIKFGISLVTEFKQELSILLKEIEATNPHYIKCIKSYDGEKYRGKGGDKAKEEAANSSKLKPNKRFSIFDKEINRFSQFNVASQLRSNGILETVRIAITGYQCRLTYIEFYHRYRLIASEIDPNFDAPLYVPSNSITDVQLKLLCNRLCDVLAVGRDDMPKSLSPGKRTISRRASFKRELSFARSRSTRTISMKDLNVDAFSLSDGIIDRKNVQFGETKVFLKLQESSFLEAFRNKCLKEFVIKIQRMLIGLLYRRKFIVLRRSTLLIQRIMRGFLARKHVRAIILLSVSVVKMQRQFRKKRFFHAIILVQMIIRSFLARRKLIYLKELKEKLAKTYGQFIIAREIRLQRRSRLQKLQGEENNKAAGRISNTSYKLSTIEQRAAFHQQQSALIDEKLTLSNLLSQAVVTNPAFPNVVIPMINTNPNNISTYSSPMISSTKRNAVTPGPVLSDSPKKPMKKRLRRKVGDVLVTSPSASAAAVSAPSIIDVIDKSMKDLPIESVAYDDLIQSWKRQLNLLSDNVSNRPIKHKAMKYLLKYLLPSEELIDLNGLIDFSMFGKMFGFSLWKNIQSLPLTNIPEVHINDKHTIFTKIHRMIERLQSLTDLIDETMTEAKQNLLVKVQYETNQTDVQVIYEIKQLCREFSFYYEDYIHYFVSEYGESSSFYQAFHTTSQKGNRSYVFLPGTPTATTPQQQKKDHLRYLLALVDTVQNERKYSLHSRQHGNRNNGNHNINQRSVTNGSGANGVSTYNINSKKSKKIGTTFTLTIDWQEMLQNLPLNHPLSLNNPNSIMNNRNSRETFFHQFGIKDSDTLRKLNEVYEGKEELKNDNNHLLRIISYNGLQFHYMPIQPGIEYSINSFRNLISGFLPPVKKLLKIIGHRHLLGKNAYYSVYCEDSSSNSDRIRTNSADNNQKKNGLALTKSFKNNTNSNNAPGNNGAAAHHDFEHHSFMDILYDPIAVEQIQSLSFSSSLITCCILGILHLQPNHVSVHMEKMNNENSVFSPQSGNLAAKTFSMSNESIDINAGQEPLHAQNQEFIRISSFESDAVMSSGFLDFNNTYRLKVHEHNLNVLFVLPQMDEPFDHELKNFFISSPFIVEEIMISWLRDLNDQNLRYNALVSSSKGVGKGADLKNAAITAGASSSTTTEFQDTDFQALNLPILLAKGSIKEMVKRLKHIVEFISEKHEDRTTVTNSKLLREFFPHVADYYEDIRHHSDFTEGIDIGGVVSYAYAYHSALKELKEWSHKLSASVGMKGTLYFENLTENTEESNGSAGNVPNGMMGGLGDLFQKKQYIGVGEEELTPKSVSSEFWKEIPVVEEKYEINPLRKSKSNLSTSQYSPNKLTLATSDMSMGNLYDQPDSAVRYPLSTKYGSPPKKANYNVGSASINNFDDIYSVRSGFSKYSLMSNNSINSNQNVLSQNSMKNHAKGAKIEDSFDYDDIFQQKDGVEEIGSFSFEETDIQRSYSRKSTQTESTYQINSETGAVVMSSPNAALSPSKKKVSFSGTPVETKSFKIDPGSKSNLQQDFNEISPLNRRRSDLGGIPEEENDHGDGPLHINPAIHEIGKSQNLKVSKSAVIAKIQDRNTTSAVNLLDSDDMADSATNSAPPSASNRIRTSSASKLQDRVTAARTKTALYGSNMSLTTNFELENRNEVAEESAEGTRSNNLGLKLDLMKKRREAFQSTDNISTEPKASTNQKAPDATGGNDTMKMFKKRQTFLQSDDIKAMNGKLLSSKNLLQDSVKEFTKRVAPLDTPIEVEATEFLKSLDFRAIREKSLDVQQALLSKGFDEVDEEGQKSVANSDFSSRLCRMIGKNLSFLETFSLKNINEQQLKAMFRFFLKANMILAQQSFMTSSPAAFGLSKKAPSTTTIGAIPDISINLLKQRLVSLQTKTLMLYFDSREELNVLRKSYILYQLKKELNLDIKLIFMKNAAPNNKGLRTDSIASPTANNASTDTPDTVRNTESGESVSQLPPSAKSPSGRFVASPVVNGNANEVNTSTKTPMEKRPSVFFYEDGNEEIIDYTIQFIVGGSPGQSAYNSVKNVSEYSIQSENLDQDDAVLCPNTPGSKTEPVVNETLRKELLSILMSTSNLFEINLQMSVQARQDVKLKVDQLKMIINHLSMDPIDIDGMESSLFYSFTQILLEYPSLSPLALILAKNYGFKKNLFFIHQLIEHKYMDRFSDLIFEIITQHPEILVMADTEGFLPCDRLKAIPDYYHYYSGITNVSANNRVSVNSLASSQMSTWNLETLNLLLPAAGKGQTMTNPPSAHKVIAKYALLTKIVNFAGQPENRYLQSMSRGGIGVGLFSHYREEEELIILATHLDFPATEAEFVYGYFNLSKIDGRKQIPLLMKLIYKEICYHYSSNYHQHQQQLSYIYHLLTRSLQNRIIQRVSTKEEISQWVVENLNRDRLDRLFHKYSPEEEQEEGYAESKDHPNTSSSPSHISIRHGVQGSIQQDKEHLELSNIYKNIQESSLVH